MTKETIQVSQMRDGLKTAVQRWGSRAFVRVELSNDGYAGLLWEVGDHVMGEPIVKGVGQSLRDAFVDADRLAAVPSSRLVAIG